MRRPVRRIPTVEPLESRYLLAVFTVTTTADSGPDSFRQAILDANALPGRDRIEFAIGSGGQTIRPLTPLPAALDAVEIDGATQPGYQGHPLIELAGFGLSLRSNNLVRGLVLNRGAGLGMTSDNVIVGNYLGTDVTGTRALTTASTGLSISGHRNRVGGTDPKDRNLISGNGLASPFGAGISIGVLAADNVVQGNYLGTDITGTKPLPNRTGIRLHVVFGGTVSNTLIGGAEPGAGNLISGNEWQGIWASNQVPSGSIVGTRIQGNRIGTDAAGVKPLGNREGIALTLGGQAVIGGFEPGAGNVVAFNRSHGIYPGGGLAAVQGNVIYGNGGYGLSVPSPNALVQGNWVVSNADVGILLGERATGSLVGGTDGQGNFVAYNGGPGIVVSGGVRIALRGNSLVGNAGPGIELRNGGNNDQPAPHVAGAFAINNRLFVGGWLFSPPKQRFDVEFFASPDCDDSGAGEGEHFLGSRATETDEDGLAVFIEALDADIPAGWAVTATATDALGNTSAFSSCATVQDAGGAPGGGLGDVLATLLVGDWRVGKKTASAFSLGGPA